MIKIGLALSFLILFCFEVMAAEQQQDPTRPLINVNAVVSPVSVAKPAEKKQSKNNLMAIIKQGRHLKAVIDHRTVKVGDLINGYRVNKIDGNTVTLSRSGKNKILTLVPSIKSVESQG